MKQVQTNYIVPAIFAGVLFVISEYKNATTPANTYVDLIDSPTAITEVVFCEEGTMEPWKEYECYNDMDNLIEAYEIPIEDTMAEYAIFIEDISDYYWQEWKE